MPLQGNGGSLLSTAVLLARRASQWEKRQGHSWRRSLQTIAQLSAAAASCLKQLSALLASLPGQHRKSRGKAL